MFLTGRLCIGIHTHTIRTFYSQSYNYMHATRLTGTQTIDSYYIVHPSLVYRRQTTEKLDLKGRTKTTVYCCLQRSLWDGLLTAKGLRNKRNTYFAVGAHDASERIVVDIVERASNLVVLHFAKRHGFLSNRKESSFE